MFSFRVEPSVEPSLEAAAAFSRICALIAAKSAVFPLEAAAVALNDESVDVYSFGWRATLLPVTGLL